MDDKYNAYNVEALFKQHLLAENVKPATLKNYSSDLRHFLGWLSVEQLYDSSLQSIQNLNEKNVRDYKKYLITNEIPLKTVNRRLSTLRNFFSFCISQRWISENLAKKISNEKGRLELPEVINSFKKGLIDEGRSNNEINEYITDVSEFLTLTGS